MDRRLLMAAINLSSKDCYDHTVSHFMGFRICLLTWTCVQEILTDIINSSVLRFSQAMDAIIVGGHWGGRYQRGEAALAELCLHPHAPRLITLSISQPIDPQ